MRRCCCRIRKRHSEVTAARTDRLIVTFASCRRKVSGGRPNSARRREPLCMSPTFASRVTRANFPGIDCGGADSRRWHMIRAFLRSRQKSGISPVSPNNESLGADLDESRTCLSVFACRRDKRSRMVLCPDASESVEARP